MSARALIVAAALALLGLAPASASALPVWQTAGPEGASTVNFHAITTYSVDATHTVVIAVGQENVAPNAPVIYRRVDGEWERQDLPAGTTGCLSKIAVTDTAAWAVGNATSCTAGTPVVLRFAGGGAELAKPATETKWTPVTVPYSTPLRAVALFGNAGYVGDAAGNVRQVQAADTDAPTFGQPVGYSPGPDATHATAVNGLALANTDEGLVAGDNSLPTGGRVYDLKQTTLSTSPFRPDSSGAVPIWDVDVVEHTPLAIEHNAYWMPDTAHQDLWTRYRPADRFGDATTDLRAVDISGSGDDITSAIAGATGAGGAVWLRNGPNGSAWVNSTGGWTEYTGLGSALEDVAVVSASDVWAAGQDGNVRHFAEPPPPPKQDEGGTGGGGETGGGGGTGGTDTGSGAGQTPQVVVVEQPAPSHSTSPSQKSTPTGSGSQPKRTGRLMRDVRVRVRRGVLIITFRLTARARVGAKASSAGRLVGVARVRLLGRGKRTLVLRYRGKRPPTQLQLFVRPAGKAAATQRTTP